MPPVDEPVRVETTTLMPGGGLATVTVRAVGRGFEVSDEGAGRMTMLGMGLQDLTRGDTRRGNEIAQSRGLVFDGQAFRASEVGPDQLTAAIAYVADACRSWAAAAIEARSKRQERDLFERTASRLRASLPGLKVDTEREMQGASTKRHKFDLVVTLRDERFALFEMLTPAPASMASVHMKFYDLMQLHQDWPREAVVEDVRTWASDDLAVMQQVATHVRGMDNAWADLQQLTA